MLKKNINIDFVTCFHVNKDINVKVHLHLYNIFTANLDRIKNWSLFWAPKKGAAKKFITLIFPLLLKLFIANRRGKTINIFMY